MKTYKRQFQTSIDLDLYTRFAQEVINGIENDTINVFRPDDEDAMDDVQDADGAMLIDAHATLPVSVREWLPVVCQFIRWECECDTRDKDATIAYYRSNAKEVLVPFGGLDPAGPGALIAGIVLRRKKCVDDNRCTTTECDRLMFILAHELVHAFQAMRFIVPAFMDWRKFWEKVLHEGTRCDLLGSNHEVHNKILDQYGTEYELREVMQFWPSQGKRWFEACHPGS